MLWVHVACAANFSPEKLPILAIFRGKYYQMLLSQIRCKQISHVACAANFSPEKLPILAIFNGKYSQMLLSQLDANK